MKRFVFIVLASVMLVSLTGLQSRQLAARPIIVKLGAPPDSQSVSLLAGSQKPAFAWRWIMRVVVYYGSLVELGFKNVKIPPEYFNMYKTIESATHLDPYNMDAYYFAQAAFTWEIGRAKEVNSLLLYGMEYRDWDYQLPFYAGFNSAYFLHDYAEAARLMKIAAERSGSSLFTKLAARYFYQAKESELGIAFLESVIEQTNNEKLRQIYVVRLEALREVRKIEKAITLFKQSKNRVPSDIHELVREGILTQIPKDPYGGTFFIDADGNVFSTSKFSFAPTRESLE